MARVLSFGSRLLPTEHCSFTCFQNPFLWKKLISTGFPSLFMSFCCWNNCHKRSDTKHHKLITLQVRGSDVQVRLPGLGLRCRQFCVPSGDIRRLSVSLLFHFLLATWISWFVIPSFLHLHSWQSHHSDLCFHCQYGSFASLYSFRELYDYMDPTWMMQDTLPISKASTESCLHNPFAV